MDAADLIDRAKVATGLADFGDDGFREGLERLVRALNREAKLSPAGQAAMATQIIDLLGQRLKVQASYQKYPAIADERIVAPLIGLGLPRTGSTALACLLGEDQGSRSLLNWQAMNPAPPPCAEPDSVAPRVAFAEAAMERRARTFPRMQQMLPSTAASPSECQLLMAQDFKAQLFQAFAWIPSYAAWFEDEADLEPTYRHVEKVLRLLQFRDGARPWRLKNPTHSLFAPTLLKVFPDARFVMTHRPIEDVIASVADVFFELSRAYSDDVDRPELARLNAASWEKAMRRMIAFRCGAADLRFFDIAFAPFMRDPFPVLEALYAWLGEDLTVDARERMQAWREANPREKHGSHQVEADDFAIDPAELRDRFAFYRARFGQYLENAR